MSFEDLTVKDRVLFFLLGFPKDSMLDISEMEMDHVVKSLPREITQEGIADSVGIRWNHASRALKELVGMNLVEQKKSNIEGGRRVRFVYFLTSEGYQLANDILTRINNNEFKILKEGELENMTFSQIYRTYGSDVPVFDFFTRFENVFSNIVAEGDLLDNVSITTVIDQLSRVHHHISLPSIDILGRENEIGLIQDVIRDGPNTISIIGLAGMGKTSLISHVLSTTRGFETFYYPIHEWDSARSVLVNVAQFLERINKGRLHEYLKAGSTEGEVTGISRFDLWEVHQILSEDLIGEKIIIAFDDYQKSGDEVRQLIGMLYSIVSEGDDLHLCVLSRTNPDFYSQKEVIADKKVFELNLAGIDYNSMKLLLEKKGVAEASEYPTIYQVTGGHPLAIDLIGGVEGFSGTDDLTTYIRDEVINSLTPQLRAFLRKVAIHRKPISIDIIASNDEDIDSLNHLISLSLISETGSEISLHDVIRVVVYDDLPNSIKKELHLEAARSLMKAPIDNQVETFFHYMHGESFEKGISLLNEFLPSFIEYGHIREIHDIIETLEVNIDNQWKSYYDVIKLEILLSLGEYEQLQEKIGQVESAGIFQNESLQYRASMIYGRSYYYEGKFEKCIQLMDGVIADAIQTNTIIQKAEALHWKGKAYTRLGNQMMSEQVFKEALSLAKENQDRILEAKVLMALSFVTDVNLEYALEAATIFQEEGALYNLAEATNHVGRLFYRRGDYQSAEKKWTQGILISKQTGNYRLTAVMQYNLSSIFIEKGDFNSALIQLKSCTNTFYRVGFASGFVYSKVGYGSYYTMKGNFDTAERFLDMGEKIARELNDEKVLELVFEEKCALFEKSGDEGKLKECRKRLSELQSRSGASPSSTSRTNAP